MDVLIAEVPSDALTYPLTLKNANVEKVVPKFLISFNFD